MLDDRTLGLLENRFGGTAPSNMAAKFFDKYRPKRVLRRGPTLNRSRGEGRNELVEYNSLRITPSFVLGSTKLRSQGCKNRSHFPIPVEHERRKVDAQIR